MTTAPPRDQEKYGSRDGDGPDGQPRGESPEEVFGRHLATLDDDEKNRSLRRARTLSIKHMSEEMFEGPQPLDLDMEDGPPDWLIAPLIERGTVAVMSGDTGAAKSIVASSLLPAALRREQWFGHGTAIERVLFLDEENPPPLARSRLRALGVPRGSGDRLRYFSRAGIAIGDGGIWDLWLDKQLSEFRPDIVIVDTLMAACDLEDTNSNPEAVRMMKYLRKLAEKNGCTILLLHHERKQSREHPQSSGQAMMGARQWAGQADAHMTLTVESDYTEEETDAGIETRRTFKWRPAEKDRSGNLNRPRRLAVTSVKDAETKELRSMQVADEGPVDAESVKDATETKILEALNDVEHPRALTRPEIAGICGEKEPREPSGAFKNVLSKLVDTGQVEKPDRLHFRLSEAGRAGLGMSF